MACKYIYYSEQGTPHEFTSELELDTWLLNKMDKLDSRLGGDLVFSLSGMQATLKDIMGIKEKEAEPIFEGMKKIAYDGDSYEIEAKGCVGVNKFLEKLEIDGKHVTPEFIPDNYFEDHRYPDWANGDYTKVEKEVIFGEETPRPANNLEKKEYRKKIEEYWNTQGEIGIQMHSVLENYFREKVWIRDNKDAAWFEAYRMNNIDRNLLTEKDIIWLVNYAKELEQNLKSRFGVSSGDELLFMPEYHMYTKSKGVDGVERKLAGIIDLLIVDPKGNVHILDYKTTPHDYALKSTPDKAEPDGFNTAKVNKFKYQLSVYLRMLRQNRLGNTNETQLLVAPIQLLGFKKTDKGIKWDGLKHYEGFVDDITAGGLDKVNSNLDHIFYVPPQLNDDISELLEKTSEDMAKFFPNIRFTWNPDDAETIARAGLKNKNNVKKNSETGKWVYTWGKSQRTTEAESEEELQTKVIAEYKKLASRTEETVNRIKKAMRNGTSLIGKYDRITKDSDKSTISWIEEIFKPYRNEGWTMVETDWANQLQFLGIILFQRGNQLDAIKISSSDLKYVRELTKGNKYISSTWENNAQAESNHNNILESSYGNMELIETVTALNYLPNLLNDFVIGKVQVINPHRADSVWATNKQILENFNILANHYKTTNNIKTSNIKFANMAILAYNQVSDIITRKNENGFIDDRYKDIASTLSSYDKFFDASPEVLRAKLLKLQMQFEERFPELRQTTSDKSRLSDDTVMAYNYISMAIAETRNFNYEQLNKDHDLWLENGDILHHGIQGLMYDNPGNTSSKLLNSMTKMIMESNQNVRNLFRDTLATTRKKVQDLKDSKNFGYITERTVGNQVNLYKNMIEMREGNLFLVDPKTLNDPAERQFLEYFLEELAKDKYKGKTRQFIESKKADLSSDYYWLPLCSGDFNSAVSVSNMFEALKFKLKNLLPRQVLRAALDNYEGVGAVDTKEPNKIRTILKDLLSPRSNREHVINQEIWEMTNKFEAGYSSLENRKDIIATRGRQYFEHNLETLLLKHKFAYLQKQEIDKIYPDLKAVKIYINFAGLMNNDYFKNISKYASDYVTSKVQHKSLDSDKMLLFNEYRKKIMSLTSKMGLGFSAKLTYQLLEGIYKDISLMLRKPDGTDTFSFKNMSKAFSIVYGEMFHYGNKRSKLELINEYLSVNDMDMGSYIDRVKSDISGTYHFFDNLLFRFASRPDFYNRQIIIVSHLLEQGIWDAISVENGKLKYDWSKDKRFNLLADPKANKASEAYKKQLSLYMAVSKQLAEEHSTYVNEKGETIEWVHDGKVKKLFTWWTSREIEGVKDISDVLYGYYTDEKKSLMQSYALGAMFLQMYTYMSGKKTQYFADQHTSIQGKFEVLKDKDGTPYYLEIDEKGNYTGLPTKDPKSGVLYYQYKGQFTEGIIKTLVDLTTELANYDPESNENRLTDNFEKWKSEHWSKSNPTYRSNLIQIQYDLFMSLVVGQLFLNQFVGSGITENIKQRGNDTLNDAIINAGANITKDILTTSTLDFNFAESLFGRGIDWTPYSISTTKNAVKHMWSAITGDETYMRSLMKSLAATRAIKPLWDYALPQIEKEESE